jgi:hypothetical protein
MRRVIALIVLVSGLVSVCLAAPAHAALFLVFQTRSYTPPGYEDRHTGGIGAAGDVVRARTAGRGALGETESMPVFLAAGGIYPNVDSAAALGRADGVTRVGDLRADHAGTGHLEFRVPELRAGRYELIGFCPECAPYSAGQRLVRLAPFRIVGGTPITTPAPRSAPIGAVVAGVVTAVALLAAGIAWRRRRGGGHEMSRDEMSRDEMSRAAGGTRPLD